jgi:glycosyltransferase involved in cell wall biosynthesis
VTVAVNYLEESVWDAAFTERVELVRLGAGHARRALKPLTELVRRIRPQAVLAFNYQLALALLAVRWHASRTSRASRTSAGSGSSRTAGSSRASGGVPPGVPRFRLVSRHIVATAASMRIKGLWHGLAVKTLLRLLYRRVDHVVAQSEAMREELIRSFRLSPDQVRVIYNPVLPASAAPGPELPEGLEELVERSREHSLRPPVILYLGRFKPQKQPLLLLDLLERVRSREPEAVLVAAGHGPLVEDFRQAVVERGLGDAVYYLGYVMNPVPLFEIAAATVLTSAYEGFPNALIDSLAHGVPVASFDCPTGPSEIIADGQNGFLIAPGDLEDMAEKVTRLIGRPQGRARLYPDGAPFDPRTIQQSAARFSLDHAIRSYEAVLHG